VLPLNHHGTSTPKLKVSPYCHSVTPERQIANWKESIIMQTGKKVQEKHKHLQSRFLNYRYRFIQYTVMYYCCSPALLE
jgi:hypothetical protein